MRQFNPVTEGEITQHAHFPNTFTCKHVSIFGPRVKCRSERAMFARGGGRWRFEYRGTHPPPCYEHNTTRSHRNSRGNDRLLNITQTSQNLQHPSEDSHRTSKRRSHGVKTWNEDVTFHHSFFFITLTPRHFKQLDHTLHFFSSTENVSYFYMHSNVLNKLYFIHSRTLAEDGFNFNQNCLFNDVHIVNVLVGFTFY